MQWMGGQSPQGRKSRVSKRLYSTLFHDWDAEPRSVESSTRACEINNQTTDTLLHQRTTKHLWNDIARGRQFILSNRRN